MMMNLFTNNIWVFVVGYHTPPPKVEWLAHASVKSLLIFITYYILMGTPPLSLHVRAMRLLGGSTVLTVDLQHLIFIITLIDTS